MITPGYTPDLFTGTAMPRGRPLYEKIKDASPASINGVKL